MNGRTVLIDGHSLAHRAYHALPPTLSDPAGRPTNAVLGFCNMLVRIMEQKDSARVICAFDSPGPVFRHDDFADYKATRKPMEEALREQIPVIKEACRAFGVEIVELPGYEADDLLGTMARSLEKAGRDVTIVTSDRDSYQLASDKVKLMMNKKGMSEFELMGPKEVKSACGVPPELVPDLKGLIGDTSDNIPGVKGIGEKAALKLIGEYGRLEDIIASIGKMKQDRTAMLLKDGAEVAFLSKKLAVIDTDAPIDFDPDKQPDTADELSLRDFLSSKGFKNLLLKMEKKAPKKESPARELFGSMPPEASLKPVSAGPASFEAILVSAESQLTEIAAMARTAGSMSIDLICEGRGWEAIPRRLVIGVSGKAFDVPVDAEGLLIGGGAIPISKAISALLHVLSDPNVRKSGWDIKTSAVMITKFGGRIEGIVFDPMIAGFLINPIGRTDSEFDLLYKYFRMPQSEFDAYGPHGGRLASAALMQSIEKAMSSELDGLGMGDLMREVEMPLIKVLTAMEVEGVNVDMPMLRAISERMGGKLKELETAIYELAGGEFNIGSPRQLGSVLFERLGLPAAKKTKTGFSTDADVLEGLIPFNPIVVKVLEHRGISKLKSTYVDVLPDLTVRHGGKIHTTFNQTGAVTGRLSSTDPNMQNIPIKSEQGLEIRAAFKAKEGSLIISADYSQIELRLLAHLSRDPVLLESFRLGQDVHTRTASEVFGVPMDQVSREMRGRAKTVNFGIIYGQTEFGLSRTLGISQQEAKEFIDRYFKRYTSVKEYFSQTTQKARKDGYVSTIMGRRRSVPELFSANFNMRRFGERIVMNAPIQGSAADIIKVAMIRLEDAIEASGWKARLLLQVHDELVLEAPEAEAPEVAKMVKRIMESAVRIDVPLIADAAIGVNWKEAK